MTDCIECGCCDLVCPSHIPLTADFRQAKARMRELADEKARAQRARERFESRNERLQREHDERDAELAAQKRTALEAGPDAIRRMVEQAERSHSTNDGDRESRSMDFQRHEAPFVTPPTDVSSIMRQVLLALIPASLACVSYFGFGFILNPIVAAAFCALGEAAMMRLRGRPERGRAR
ncbi:MAG: RnfABCDGE type electron transport complex subunit D [Woeseiaceae bacterium]|nr:RnfABCDGE type electron transport complex subunit D [Woeseiaceae bacterium]